MEKRKRPLRRLTDGMIFNSYTEMINNVNPRDSCALCFVPFQTSSEAANHYSSKQHQRRVRQRSSLQFSNSRKTNDTDGEDEDKDDNDNDKDDDNNDNNDNNDDNSNHDSNDDRDSDIDSEDTDDEFDIELFVESNPFRNVQTDNAEDSMEIYTGIGSDGDDDSYDNDNMEESDVDNDDDDDDLAPFSIYHLYNNIPCAPMQLSAPPKDANHCSPLSTKPHLNYRS